MPDRSGQGPHIDADRVEVEETPSPNGRRRTRGRNRGRGGRSRRRRLEALNREHDKGVARLERAEDKLQDARTELGKARKARKFDDASTESDLRCAWAALREARVGRTAVLVQNALTSPHVAALAAARGQTVENFARLQGVPVDVAPRFDRRAGELPEVGTPGRLHR